MTALENSVQTASFPTYSHGLESIYKIETIDVKSIRKLSDSKPKVPTILLEEGEDHQLSFDFGPSFRSWISPITLLEPLQVLGLPKPIEKMLNEKEFRSVGDLQSGRLKEVGLGQGHVEDIQLSLGRYLAGKPLKRSLCIDFTSICKCLFGHLDPKKVQIALSSFGLTGFAILSSSDQVELKRITKTTQMEWTKEVFKDAFFSLIEEHLSDITRTWLKPWMALHHGVGSEAELTEVLHLRALDPVIAEKALKIPLLKELFFKFLDGKKGVFALDHSKFNQVIELALSYFPTYEITYEIDELFQALGGELAAQFQSLSKDELKRFLELSSHFELYRDALGAWRVKSCPSGLFSLSSSI